MTEFICKYCKKVLQAPVVCNMCKCNFCFEHIQKHLEDKDALACNATPANIGKYPIKKQKALENLSFTCPGKCEKKINYKDLHSHCMECLEQPKFSCIYKQNLKQIGYPNNLINMYISSFNEQKNIDPGLKNICPFCEEYYSLELDFVNHKNICKKSLIYCFDCLLVIPHENSHFHKTYICPQLRVLTNFVWKLVELLNEKNN